MPLIKLGCSLKMNNRVKIALLSVSLVGVTAITQFEGFESTTYLDVGGVPTIGYGSTKDVHVGDRIDEKGARRRLISELTQDYQPSVNNCVKVPLSQNEYDAYMALVYNIGSGAFCKSTLVKQLNAGNYIEACNQILRWNRVQGKVVRGLTNRRIAEHKMCMEGQDA